VVPFGLALLVVVAWKPCGRYVRAGEFLLTLSRLGKNDARTKALETPIATEELTLAGSAGPLRARLYFRANHASGPGIVVAHGVHYQGIDERRLVPFARALAREGLVVLTPELSDLADYRITGRGIGVIEDSVRYLESRHDRVSGERVGVLGFSFAGGLALVAAALPELRGKISFVTSVGGHQDLSRVLHFLLHDEIQTPRGLEQRKAHEYGLVVLLYGNLERFVPEADLPAMRAAFKAWLEEDRPRAYACASRRTTLEAERLWDLLERGELRTLAPELDALLTAQAAELRALSPRGHLREIGVPVYLLHGAHDAVIPPSETEFGALELGREPHAALVSPLLEHVEVNGAAGFREELDLIAFMAHLF
jgi:dienelactone hydrolase